ncbi:hypothetical protein KAI46_08310 [bacterium]|nr:hypothetical protein [bacterium]
MFEKYRKYFDSSFDDLPNKLKQDVTTDFFPIGWERLSPKQRESFTKQHSPITMDDHFEAIYEMDEELKEKQRELDRSKEDFDSLLNATSKERADKKPASTPQQYIEELMNDKELRKKGDINAVIIAMVRRDFKKTDITDANIGYILEIKGKTGKTLTHGSLRNTVCELKKIGDKILGIR